MNRQELANLCGVSLGQAQNIIFKSAEFKHSGHRGSQNGVRSYMFGKRVSEESRQRHSSAQKAWLDKDPEHRATAKRHMAKIRPLAVTGLAEWRKRNPLRVKAIIATALASRNPTSAEGLLLSHIRWHAGRGILKASCPLCAVVLQANELLNPQVSASQ
jgi:hypothetical protein